MPPLRVRLSTPFCAGQCLDKYSMFRGSPPLRFFYLSRRLCFWSPLASLILCEVQAPPIHLTPRALPPHVTALRGAYLKSLIFPFFIMSCLPPLSSGPDHLRSIPLFPKAPTRQRTSRCAPTDKVAYYLFLRLVLVTFRSPSCVERLRMEGDPLVLNPLVPSSPVPFFLVSFQTSCSGRLIPLLARLKRRAVSSDSFSFPFTQPL